MAESKRKSWVIEVKEDEAAEKEAMNKDPPVAVEVVEKEDLIAEVQMVEKIETQLIQPPRDWADVVRGNRSA